MGISFKEVTHKYPTRKRHVYDVALDNLSFDINEKNEFVAIVGKTGSGKSTLIQHMNALKLPSSGTVSVFDKVITNKPRKNPKLKEVRKKVGFVFQFPEYQLFEETVLKDVAFGPSNFGLKKDEAIKLAKECLSIVNIPEEYYEKSPFELSGGEKRRVAIAGLLASSPDVLILDEPTAGLDPKSSRELLELFKKLNESGKTIILVTHDMNIVFEYASEVVVMKNGQIAKQCAPNELFLSDEEEYSLETPLIAKFIQKLNDKGVKLNLSNINSIETLVEEIKKARSK